MPFVTIHNTNTKYKGMSWHEQVVLMCSPAQNGVLHCIFVCVCILADMHLCVCFMCLCVLLHDIILTTPFLAWKGAFERQKVWVSTVYAALSLVNAQKDYKWKIQRTKYIYVEYTQNAKNANNMRQEIQMQWAWTLFANFSFQCMCKCELEPLLCKCTIVFPPWRYVRFLLPGKLSRWVDLLRFDTLQDLVHMSCKAPTYSALLHIWRAALKSGLVQVATKFYWFYCALCDSKERGHFTNNSQTDACGEKLGLGLFQIWLILTYTPNLQTIQTQIVDWEWHEAS